MSVREYNPSDTPSGFLRWSRPAPAEPSRVRRLSRGLKATTKRYPMHHLVTWALLLGITLALSLWYIWNFLTIECRLPSVLKISIESITMEQHVWCGMVTFAKTWQYCARGTIDLRIRNRLWMDLTIEEGELQPIRPVRTCLTRFQHPDGLLQIGGTEVKAMSEGVYILPALLLAWSVEDFSASGITICVGTLWIDAQGNNFERRFDFDSDQVPNFTLPVPPS
ncbi:hypothetical protein FOZ61_007635 [Perkinsus olseni]|uniref:Uncharacterized protein n=1 Tax=Perkinsus olseni TaxID=32597 RepID=A0A7J6L5E2_PEROL|nr:hypothetical protein FOL46_008738 [Perkinsus olseni]KAF4655328.1 hypothetical protein FOZ61_007635 [Perkinsus olseni]